jgi:hypothetical protein
MDGGPISLPLLVRFVITWPGPDLQSHVAIVQELAIDDAADTVIAFVADREFGLIVGIGDPGKDFARVETYPNLRTLSEF